MNTFLRLTTIISAFVMLTGCQYSRINSANSFDVSTPNEQGVDSIRIRQLINDIHNKKIRNVHSIVIIKNGKQIVEEYFTDYNRNSKHYTASVSKSIGSILLGIAIDNNMLEENHEIVLERTISEIFVGLIPNLTRLFLSILRSGRIRGNISLHFPASINLFLDTWRLIKNKKLRKKINLLRKAISLKNKFGEK